MFEFFQNASDDQLALIGCAGALLGSGFLMYVSYFFGPQVRHEQGRELELLVERRRQLLETPPLEPAHERAA
jgi:hypothetical protein